MKPARLLAACTLAAVAAGLPGAARAWGEEGHRITGLVAQQLLTPQAAQGVRQLMGQLDLAGEALYLDQNKATLAQQVPGSRHWHFDDRPVCEPQVPQASYCAGGHCATVQIVAHYRTLIDHQASLADRRFALRTLVHLVGDIHQPLHASDHGDAGGNGVAVSLARAGAPQDTDLHTAWDTLFVRQAMNHHGVGRAAHDWLAAASADDLAQWKKGSPAAWDQESYELAQTVAYGALPGFACPAENYGDERVTLDAAYAQRAAEVVPKQLLKAGVRIATLLNRAFRR